jgi:hypothetical protein
MDAQLAVLMHDQYTTRVCTKDADGYGADAPMAATNGSYQWQLPMAATTAPILS